MLVFVFFHFHILVFEGVDAVPKKDAIVKNETHIMEPKRTKTLTT